MSPQAVTRRLKLASELRDLCLSLKKAGKGLREQERNAAALERSRLSQASDSRNSTR